MVQLRIVSGASFLFSFFAIGQRMIYFHEYIQSNVRYQNQEGFLTHQNSLKDKHLFISPYPPEEINQSNSPTLSNLSKQPLEFVHITKTGGTSIEAAGARAGINWGLCHYSQRDKSGCTQPVDLNYIERKNPFLQQPPWHVPLQFLVENPFQNSETFAVVRNPYDRYISEYYCGWGYDGPQVSLQKKEYPSLYE